MSHLQQRWAVPKLCCDEAAGKQLSWTRAIRASETITRGFPLWTLAAAGAGLRFPIAFAQLGSPQSFRRMLALLMLAMGLTITPQQLAGALRTAPRALAVNLGCCFVVAPLVTLAMSALLGVDGPTRVGLVLLGCVSGGQASNLCALIAGGDVALSIVLTLSTTLFGVVATPVLVSLLLGSSVPVDAPSVLRSTATLVLAPLLGGLGFVSACPRPAAAIAPACPAAAVVATLCLIAGGAANAAGLTVGAHAAGAWKAHAGVIITPLVACAAAARISSACGLSGVAVRTVAIETLVKSPTVAYVLAITHFGAAAAVPPAVAMVWLAALGAAVAFAWGRRGLQSHPEPAVGE